MSADRELLELAAKAAGMSIDRDDCGNPVRVEWFRGHLRNEYPWDPLTDDGDALRLAARLNMQIHFGRHEVMWTDGDRWLSVKWDDGDYKRGITSLAAEIGRQMP